MIPPEPNDWALKAERQARFRLTLVAIIVPSTVRLIGLLWHGPMCCARRNSTDAIDGGESAHPILIIDDEPASNEAMSLLLSRAGFRIVCCTEPDGFVERCVEADPACIIIDLFLQQVSGLDVLRELRSRGCAAPVLMMSGRGDISHAVRAVRLGAFDFIEKPFRGEQLVAHVRAAIASRYRQPRAGFRFPGRAPLTAREQEVLLELIAGRTTKEAALQLGLSPRTIESHRVTIMRKVGARNPAELVRLAMTAMRD